MQDPEQRHNADPQSLESVQRKVIEISELAGGLAHEIRNPLSTLKVNLQLLSEDLQEAEDIPGDFRRRTGQRLAGLQSEASRLQVLLDRFLNFMTLHQLERSDLDIGILIEQLLDFFEPQAREQNIELELLPNSAPLICEIDEALLKQALMNIVINAQQAMPHGGRLSVRIAATNNRVSITFLDSGPGVETKELEQLFQPFYSTKKSGFGLGLPLTRRIIHEHGGDIAVESPKAGGCLVTVELPLVSRSD